jgi:hypothetical protein
MPPQAFALAFAASIYPPAVAAVIALGRGADVRLRVSSFVAASLLVTYAVGALILYVLVEVGATGSRHLTPGGWVDVALGVLLLLLALHLRLRRRSPLAALASRRRHGRAAPESKESSGGSDGETSRTGKESEAEPGDPGDESKIERYLQSRGLAFVLGIVLYVLPSPIYIGAVKSIADANTSASAELTSLVVVVLIMLWMVELPMLMLLAFPSRATATLESINRWFARNGRTLAILAAFGAGVYLIVKGVVQLT